MYSPDDIGWALDTGSDMKVSFRCLSVVRETHYDLTRRVAIEQRFFS